jgi:hypothetical protein
MSSVDLRGRGSLVNAIYAQTRDPGEIKVGTPCTMLFWSDRYPAQITRVSQNGRTVWIRECRSEPAPGSCNAYTESQAWLVGEPFGEERPYTLRKNGKFVRKGDGLRGQALLIGVAEKYIDPSF